MDLFIHKLYGLIYKISSINQIITNVWLSNHSDVLLLLLLLLILLYFIAFYFITITIVVTRKFHWKTIAVS